MKTIFRHMLLYGLLGPVIGAVLTTIPAMFMTADHINFSVSGILAFILTFPYMLLFAIPVGYVVGGAQALFVGLCSGIAKRRWGETPFWLPLAAAFVAWGAFVTVASQISKDGGGLVFGFVGLGMLALQLTSAMAVWFIARWRRKTSVT